MTLSTPGSLDNANYIPTDTVHTNSKDNSTSYVIYNFDDLEYQLLFHYYLRYEAKFHHNY